MSMKFVLVIHFEMYSIVGIFKIYNWNTDLSKDIGSFVGISIFIRVPTSTGNHGKPRKSPKKVQCMEKSWNLKKLGIIMENHRIL